ncbi:Holliday junction resolvase [Ligilactobacillus salitolerans]|uniref:Holliday junction resolvase n=1 Tax=Ligilactobacillus salitolerans TaxID=1808352 RepID=A0A401IUL1_9LACO|nr:RusA family crossover junction endodeoxyribonuclease [Ligilactobacillus salitolerans]GBG95206.1 Holliday junction resolvase [Ligilactobacillus salitolerans]
MKLQFDISPVAQARPRATRMGQGIRLYDPKKTAEFKKGLRLLAQAEHVEPLQDALRIEIWFYRAVQKSISKKEHARRITGIIRPIVKPDVDNYIKSTLDGLNGILWRDDAQIVDLVAHKCYAEHPRIEIELEEIS